jgi:hypothetical protein
MAGNAQRTVDVDLRAGFANLIPLANGVIVRIETIKHRGRVRLRVFDAASGERIKTIRLPIPKA